MILIVSMLLIGVTAFGSEQRSAFTPVPQSVLPPLKSLDIWNMNIHANQGSQADTSQEAQAVGADQYSSAVNAVEASPKSTKRKATDIEEPCAKRRRINPIVLIAPNHGKIVELNNEQHILMAVQNMQPLPLPETRKVGRPRVDLSQCSPRKAQRLQESRERYRLIKKERESYKNMTNSFTVQQPNLRHN